MTEFNWADYLILILLAIYAYLGYSFGLLRASLDLARLAVSIIFGLVLYGFLGKILAGVTSIPQGFANAIGFFMILILVQFIVRAFLKNYFTSNPTIFKTLNQIIAILPGILSGIILCAFLLTLAIAMPIASYIKDSIFSAKIGKVLVFYSQTSERNLKKILGRKTYDGLNFLTVDPSSNEKIILNFRSSGKIDRNAEENMFDLINRERLNAGLPELAYDDKLRDIGRKHCDDMFANRYFSHYNLRELSPSDRMEEENTIYSKAGENLVLSPNAGLAMEGLMDSPIHKAYILSLYFGRVGIGIIDGGIYGKMFCQEFTD